VSCDSDTSDSPGTGEYDRKKGNLHVPTQEPHLAHSMDPAMDISLFPAPLRGPWSRVRASEIGFPGVTRTL
jgi:hypothetical protein